MFVMFVITCIVVYQLQSNIGSFLADQVHSVVPFRCRPGHNGSPKGQFNVQSCGDTKFFIKKTSWERKLYCNC